MSQQANFDKSNYLKWCGLFSKGERASDIFSPNEKNSSAEALFCISNCPHKDKPCNGECKEIREWLKNRKKEKK